MDKGTNNDYLNNFVSLYNGNIGAMITNLTKQDETVNLQAQMFRYDNLNRIRNSVAVSSVDYNLRAGDNTWDGSEIVGSVIGGSFQNGLATSYTYDPAGNISDLTRTDLTGNLFDNFHYNYETLTINGFDQDIGSKNKLEYISDLANSNLRTDDIDNQSVGNYSYDLNGRLISDVNDGVTLIKWSKSDKVLEVHKPNGTLTIKYNALDQKISQSTSRNDSIVTEYFVYDPSGNVLATYGDTVTSGNHMFALKQLMIYGSSRVGVLEADVMLWSQIGNATPEIATFGNIFSLKLGQKRYELSNHLGNVSTVVSDRKLVDSHLGGQITAWKADVISVSDYYAFGMKITERSWSSDTYRFGFNGKDFFSDWNRQDYGFRIYDSRKCRFESVDPLHSKYPELTTYQFASNRCIDGIDLDGREYDRRSQSELVESSTLRTTTTPYLHQDKNLIWPSVNPKGYTITKVLTSGGIIAVCTYFNIPTPFTTALVNSNLAYWDGKSTKEIISAGAGGFVTGTIAGRIPIIGEISGKYFSEKQILQTPVAEYIKQFGVGGLSAVGGNIVEQQLNIFLGQNKEINNGEILSNFYIGGLFNGVFSLIKINVDVEIPSVKQTIGERATASSKQIPKPYIATPIESNGGLFEIVKEKLVIQGQLNGALEVGQDGYKSKISNTVNQNVESKKD